MSTRPWALVSPSSRGIGLALTRRVLQTTRCPVVATARRHLDQTRAAVLHGLDAADAATRLTVLQLDVNDEATIASAAANCAAAFPAHTAHLHLALVAPGVLFPEKSPAQIDADDALLTLRTNVLGPLLVMKHFSAFLPGKRAVFARGAAEDDAYEGLSVQRALWATMSARVGSIADNGLGGWYSYRASKAAVNQLVKTFDLHLRTRAADKAVSVGLHPGTVKTALSEEFWASVGEDGLFEAGWVAERLVGLCTGVGAEGIGVEGRGRCWDWKGEEIPP